MQNSIQSSVEPERHSAPHFIGTHPLGNHQSFAARTKTALAARLSGAGGLYNFGNVIALVAGVTTGVLEAWGASSASEAAFAYLFGSPAATWLTISLIIFIIAGEVYHRALSSEPQNIGLVRVGDLISVLAAAALVGSLIHLGDVALAIATGVLLGGGRLGSALSPDGSWRVGILSGIGRRRCRSVTFDVFRLSVVLSRFPTLLLLAFEVLNVFMSRGPASAAFLPAIMFGCFMIWLRADILLMKIGAPDATGIPIDSKTPHSHNHR